MCLTYNIYMYKNKPIIKKFIASVTITLLSLSSLTAQAKDKDTVVKAGDALELLIPAAAAGIAWGKEDMTGFWQLAKAEVTTVVVSEGLKYSVNEKRPNGDKHSFPSAHTSVTFTSAQYLQQRYGWEYGVPAYLASTFVGYSRVHGKEHYWRDVIAGAGIGMASGAYFTEPLFGAKVVLTPLPGQMSITASKSW
jgi:membrane-associated phospholipid phosphatase